MPNLNQKKYIKPIILVVAIVSLIAITAISILPSDFRISDEDIKNRFECDRLTDDVRPTDVYCASPDKYREDMKNRRVIN